MPRILFNFNQCKLNLDFNLTCFFRNNIFFLPHIVQYKSSTFNFVLCKLIHIARLPFPSLVCSCFVDAPFPPIFFCYWNFYKIHMDLHFNMHFQFACFSFLSLTRFTLLCWRKQQSWFNPLWEGKDFLLFLMSHGMMLEVLIHWGKSLNTTLLDVLGALRIVMWVNCT